VECDLSKQLGPARDQGARPTCLSFALSDCHRVRRGVSDDFSPECIHSISSEKMGHGGNQAISLSSALKTLVESGQTYEHEWPYGGHIKPGLKKPFNTIHSNNFQFDEDRIMKNLLGARSVVVGLGIGEEFFRADPFGRLSDKDRKPIEAQHALVITGSEIVAGTRNFRLRNSWGPGWGDAGSLWVHRSYLSSGIFVELSGTA